jgi:hypothetical protein
MGEEDGPLNPPILGDFDVGNEGEVRGEGRVVLRLLGGNMNWWRKRA